MYTKQSKPEVAMKKTLLAKGMVALIFVMMIAGEVFGINLSGWLSGEKDLVIASRSRSSFSIYVATNAANSIKKAAIDLQHVLEVSTGAKLAVTNIPVSPMICLGDNEESHRAGLFAESLSAEAFIITVKKGNLYILGKDWGDIPPPIRKNGFSCGTMNGVYEFLERFIGARWLIPGDIGEDIPQCKAVVVPAGTMIQGAPVIEGRHLPYIQNRCDNVSEWSRRMRLGGALDLETGHVWQSLLPDSVLTNHLEYMALVKGKRVRPDVPGAEPCKFCTTNPDLIKVFAEAIMAEISKHPEQKSFSISPSDGYGFCECSRCTALDEPCDWEGWKLTYKDWKSITRRILTFYNAVARIVAERYPDKILCGYVYAMYTYPPLEQMKLDPHLFLVLAPRPYYGCTLYRPELQAEFPKLLHEWQVITQGRLGYYDLPTLMTEKYFSVGTPQPPGRSILKCIFPVLGREKLKYIYFYGFGAWGYGALHNYVVARLMWDPARDVDELCDEWLRRAYGGGAAPMKRLYDLLETELGNYKRGHNANYRLLPEIVHSVYLKIFPEIERLYSQAMAAPKTELQQKRLAMFGDNLILLHWNLRKANLLEAPQKSMFYRSDDEFRKFAERACGSLAFSPGKEAPKGVSAVDEFMRPQLSVAEHKKAVIPIRSKDIPPPIIDGDLSDVLWKNAVVMDKFSLLGKHQGAGQGTEARVAFDADNIYISFLCHEDETQSLQAACVKRDDNAIYDNDCVEVFLGQAEGDQKKSEWKNCGDNYWHITINSANTVWDCFRGKVEENIAVKSAVRKGKQDWTVEMAIPMRDLRFGDVAGKKLMANLTREEKPHSENSSWNPVEISFASPLNFGVWEFFSPNLNAE